MTTLIDRRGKPGMIVSANGTEFSCNAMLTWSEDNQIAWHFIAPGKPMQVNPVLRPRSCRAKIANWPDDYNSLRPHSSLRPRRQPHRNVRSAAQPRPAPPIARCAKRRNIRRDSNRHWMKLQWQVSVIGFDHSGRATQSKKRESA
jgi:transposase InsO family protein